MFYNFNRWRGMGASSFRRSEAFQVLQTKWISYRELGPHRTGERTGEANVKHPSLALRSQVQLSSGSQEAAATRGQENAENDCQHLSRCTFPEWVIGRGICPSSPCKNAHLPEPMRFSPLAKENSVLHSAFQITYKPVSLAGSRIYTHICTYVHTALV